MINQQLTIWQRIYYNYAATYHVTNQWLSLSFSHSLLYSCRSSSAQYRSHVCETSKTSEHWNLGQNRYQHSANSVYHPTLLGAEMEEYRQRVNTIDIFYTSAHLSCLLSNRVKTNPITSVVLSKWRAMLLEPILITPHFLSFFSKNDSKMAHSGDALGGNKRIITSYVW